MAKTKRRTGMKISKRGKVQAAPKRKKPAKRAATKKLTSKVRKATRSSRKMTAKKRTGAKVTTKSALRKKLRNQTAKLPVENTVIDVVDEPAPGVVRVTEYEMVRPIAPQRDSDSDQD
jgi:hypothetical protein